MSCPKVAQVILPLPGTGDPKATAEDAKAQRPAKSYPGASRPGFSILHPRSSILAGSSVALALLAAAPRAFACAACYGQSDSAMAQGMNWGILSLLFIIVGVLGAVAAFFIYLARKSRTAPAVFQPALSRSSGPNRTTEFILPSGAAGEAAPRLNPGPAS